MFILILVYLNKWICSFLSTTGMQFKQSLVCVYWRINLWNLGIHIFRNVVFLVLFCHVEICQTTLPLPNPGGSVGKPSMSMGALMRFCDVSSLDVAGRADFWTILWLKIPVMIYWSWYMIYGVFCMIFCMVSNLTNPHWNPFVFTFSYHHFSIVTCGNLMFLSSQANTNTHMNF